MTTISMPPPAAPAPARGFLRSPALKFVLISLLTVALTVPLLLTWALTDEREARRDEVAATVAREWGGRQAVTGPVLAIPFMVERSVVADGQPARLVREERTAFFLPDTVTATASAATQVRRISIFETPVYAAETDLDARFGALDRKAFGPAVTGIGFDRAVILVGLGDLLGVEAADVQFDGTRLDVQPGPGVAIGDQGPVLHVAVPVTATANGTGGVVATGFRIQAKLRLKGTDSLSFAPVGRQSEITLSSDWPHPAFSEFTLPSEREVRPDGFSATWRVPFLARSVPQAWVFEEAGWNRFTDHQVGAGFRQPVDFYALVERALKYGLMFVAAVFGIVFVLEVLSSRRIHVVQYALVGLILIFFFVLLLALSEHVGFGIAYAAASGATTLVIAAFVGLALASGARMLVTAAGLGALFGLLYAILQLEDVALLAGAAVGFIGLSAALFATRRVDWSGTAPPAPG